MEAAKQTGPSRGSSWGRDRGRGGKLLDGRDGVSSVPHVCVRSEPMSVTVLGRRALQMGWSEART